MEYPQITQIAQISAKRLSITVEPEHFIPRMCAVSLTGRASTEPKTESV
jgi:hypothetical protein